jgi:nucleoside-diphosphate-sugar epimerase
MNILLTGADGFIGSKVCKSLTQRPHSLHTFTGDIRNLDQLKSFVTSNSKVDVVIHLAGMAHPPICDKDPQAAHDVNVKGTENLIRCVKEVSKTIPIIFPSTAQVYAQVSEGHKIDEQGKAYPKNIYAQTKWEAEKVFQTSNLNAVILRIFNYTHKTQSPELFLPGIYQQLLKMKNSNEHGVTTGNVELYRDIGAVQDLVTAITMIAEKSPLQKGIEVFNICSGTAKQLRSLILSLGKRLGIEPNIRTDVAKVRKNDPTWVCGSFQKAKNQFGWEPLYQNESQLIDGFLKDL